MTPAHAAIRALVVTHGLDDVRRALRLVTEEWDDGSDEPVERTEPRHRDWHRWVRGREVGRRVEWRCRVCGLRADAPQSAKTPGAVKGRARQWSGEAWHPVERLPVCEGVGDERE